MKHIESIVSEIVSAMTTDTFAFYYGKKPDQNFGLQDDGTEIKGPVCFMDTIVKAPVDNKMTAVREHKVPISLFWAFEADMNNISQAQKLVIKNTAWTAAKEFANRLMRYEDDAVIVYSFDNETLTDVEGVFDLHLNGVLQEMNVILRDNSSTCTT